jgi:protocatechuate 3,4-dioxygenase, beta subunit
LGAAMPSFLSRRSMLWGAGLSGLLARPGLAAIAVTPRQTEGPFYPREIPLDADNDLVRVTGRAAEAMGEVTHLSGRVRDSEGKPIAAARVEIWQCDSNGRYIHPGDRGGRPRDPNFQGFGHSLTDAAGGYRFRTIKPVAYSGRAPHIHAAVLAPGRPRFVTQLYVLGAPENERDFLLRNLAPDERAQLLVRFEPAPATEPKALAAQFEIVLPG